MTQQIQKEARMDKLEEYCNGLQLRFFGNLLLYFLYACNDILSLVVFVLHKAVIHKLFLS